MSNIPVSNLSTLYVRNLLISNNSTTPNTKINVTAGAARDSTNTNDIVLSDAVIIDATINGANGLDTGDLAVSTWYAIHIIGSSLNVVQPACLLSTSRPSPTLPAGYDIFRWIGWALTDGSSNLLKYFIRGNSNSRTYFWDAPVTELNAQGSATYAAVDLDSSVAPTATTVYLNWKLVPATAGNLTKLRTTGSTSTTNIELTGSVAAQPNAGQIIMAASSALQIDYINASASDDLTLVVTGFVDYI